MSSIFSIALYRLFTTAELFHCLHHYYSLFPERAIHQMQNISEKYFSLPLYELAIFNASSMRSNRKSARRDCHSEHERSKGVPSGEEFPYSALMRFIEEILR